MQEDTNKNPVQAVDAILENDFEVDGLTVHPLTLGRYALLELLESPFIFTSKKFTLSEVIPSAYVMTQPISDIAGYDSTNIADLRKKSLVWADEGDFKHFEKVISAILRRIQLVNDAAPHGSSGEDSPEKKTT